MELLRASVALLLCVWYAKALDVSVAELAPMHTQAGSSRPATLSWALRRATPAADMILASDMSYLSRLDCAGECSPYRAVAGGPTADALAMAAAGGTTHVRLRLWVDPSTHTANPWPSADADYTYASIAGVLEMAKRVVGAGLKVWLDLHYSDVWADPGHQSKPAAWAALSGADLAAAVANHTFAALTALAQQGTPAAVVQIGNEVSAGMLWAQRPGDVCSDGGALFLSGCEAQGADGNWPQFAALVAAGLRAARDAAPGALLIMHSDLGNKLNTSWGAAYIVTFYQNMAKYGAGDYDAVGLSFYPMWGSGWSEDIAKLTAVSSAFPDKKIIVAETAYAYEGSAGPGLEFPYTPAGQLAWVRAVVAQVRALPTGAGIAYWGSEFFNIEPGAGWSALWDKSGVALPALSQAFKDPAAPSEAAVAVLSQDAFRVQVFLDDEGDGTPLSRRTPLLDVQRATRPGEAGVATLSPAELAALPASRRLVYRVRVRLSGSWTAWSAPQRWRILPADLAGAASFICTDPVGAADLRASFLRAEFNIPAGRSVASAVLHATGLGIFRVLVNGADLLGAEYGVPGQTDWRKRVLVSSYDVPAALLKTTNAIAALVGNGMYNVPDSGRQVLRTNPSRQPTCPPSLTSDKPPGPWTICPAPLQLHEMDGLFRAPHAAPLARCGP